MTRIDFSNGVIGTDRHDFSFYTAMEHPDMFKATFTDTFPIEHNTVPVSKEAMLRAVGMANDKIIDKINKSAETNCENSSLMLYAPSVNSTQIETNIEDRTMNYETQLNAARKELNELRNKSEQEVRKIDDVLLTVTVRQPSNRIDWSLNGESLDDAMKLAEYQEKRYHKGRQVDQVTVGVRSLDLYSQSVRMTQELQASIDELTHYVHKTYAQPMADLRAKKFWIKEAMEAERNLERVERKSRKAQTVEDCVEDTFFF